MGYFIILPAFALLSALLLGGILVAHSYRPWRHAKCFMVWGYLGCLVGFVSVNVLVLLLGYAIMGTVSALRLIGFLLLWLGPIVGSILGCAIGGCVGVRHASSLHKCEFSSDSLESSQSRQTTAETSVGSKPQAMLLFIALLVALTVGIRGLATTNVVRPGILDYLNARRTATGNIVLVGAWEPYSELCLHAAEHEVKDGKAIVTLRSKGTLTKSRIFRVSLPSDLSHFDVIHVKDDEGKLVQLPVDQEPSKAPGFPVVEILSKHK